MTTPCALCDAAVWRDARGRRFNAAGSHYCQQAADLVDARLRLRDPAWLAAHRRARAFEATLPLHAGPDPCDPSVAAPSPAPLRIRTIDAGEP